MAKPADSTSSTNTSHSRFYCSRLHGSLGLKSLQVIAGAFLQKPQPIAGSPAHGTARRGGPATGRPSSSTSSGCPTRRCRFVKRLRSGWGVRTCRGQRIWSVLPFHTSLRVHRQAWAQDARGDRTPGIVRGNTDKLRSSVPRRSSLRRRGHVWESCARPSEWHRLLTQSAQSCGMRISAEPPVEGNREALA